MVLFSIAGIVFNLGQSVVLVMQGKLIDTVSERSPFPVVLRATGFLLLMVLFFQGCRYTKRFAIRHWANRTIARMRQEVYDHLVTQSLSELEQEQIGDLMTKAVGDVDISVEGIRKTTTEIFDTGVLMAGYAATLCISSWRITAMCVWWIPLSMFLASRLKTVVARLSKASREQQSRVTGMTFDMASKTVLLRTASMEEPVLARYRQELKVLQKKATLASLLESSLGPLYQGVASIGFIFVLFFGGKLVVDGTWSIGSFSSYSLLFSAFTVKASKASKLFNAWQKAQVSFGRIRPLLSGHPKEDTTIHHPLDPERRLVVSHLSFRYPQEEKWVIKDVSFTAEPGEVVGITGPVASGKSTLNIALEGLYPYEGSVKLGGWELRELSGFERGTYISWQGHQSELLSASIRENVTLGEKGDISRVLRDVAFDKDMERMPDGEETMVGSSGVRLSGGQGQRISLARALWRGSPLILLDDPFGSVDLATERHIIHSIRTHYTHSIIILVSHRLAMFPETDQVGFLSKDGRLSMGTHQSQMEGNPLYREMFELQQKEVEDHEKR
ncbi:MAG: ABC transporter ATP-binding protein [Spirochaetales bacterium]|nr:ABC transporter ATP-binding protein [Spirochaetales bacterium]